MAILLRNLVSFPFIEKLIKAHDFDKSQGSGSILSGSPAVSTMAHLTTTRFTPVGIQWNSSFQYMLGAGLSFVITPHSFRRGEEEEEKRG
jgi:hypothetical protein